MTDILQDMEDLLAAMHRGDLKGDLDFNTVYTMLIRAVNEIERLRKANSDMSWELNPDRMGGQFTREETERNWDG
jgi:hypothetical protein